MSECNKELEVDKKGRVKGNQDMNEGNIVIFLLSYFQ